MKLTGEQVEKAFYETTGFGMSGSTLEYFTDYLNKLLENEPKEFKITLTALKELTEKLDKIQEQLTSFADGDISKQFALFLEKQTKRDSDILKEIAILDEKVKERWGDNYRVEFDIDPECGSGSVQFLVNDSQESIDDFHKKDNYESGRNTGIHALLTIDWDKFEQSPQKEIQEKSCDNCDKRFNDNGEVNEDCVGCVKQDKFDKIFYTHWESEETPQEKSCENCNNYDQCYTTRTLCSFYVNETEHKSLLDRWQPKQESRGK